MRKASSMIELVIAIVVMGIAMMTLPLMLERTQENNAFAMQQEALLAARTQIGDMTTYPWDDNSLKDNKVAILDTNASDIELARTSATSPRRVGHVNQDRRRKFFDSNEANNAASTALGPEGGDLDDIDDFDDGVAKTLIAGETADIGLDYRFDLNMTTNVAYISDTATYANQDLAFTLGITPITAGSTNIKMTELILQGSGLDGNMTLRAYSSNIGESELLRRIYE